MRFRPNHPNEMPNSRGAEMFGPMRSFFTDFPNQFATGIISRRWTRPWIAQERDFRTWDWPEVWHGNTQRRTVSGWRSCQTHSPQISGLRRGPSGQFGMRPPCCRLWCDRFFEQRGSSEAILINWLTRRRPLRIPATRL